MSDADPVGRIRVLVADSPFHGEGYRKLWARLRHDGVRTSRRRVLRVMREHGLLAHQRTGSPRGPRAHDGTITTARVVSPPMSFSPKSGVRPWGWTDREGWN
jgi:hypothetical protein